jgi:hypothetical protein
MRTTGMLAIAAGVYLGLPVFAVAVLLGMVWWITRHVPGRHPRRKKLRRRFV